MQRALMQFSKPEKYFAVREALIQAGRVDLIGSGCDCLIPAQPPKEAIEARRRQANDPDHYHTVGNPSTGEKPGERGLPNKGYRPRRRTARRQDASGKAEAQAHGRRQRLPVAMPRQSLSSGRSPSMADDIGQIVRADTAEREGFAQLLCVEWTKFRKTRSWVIGVVVVALVTVSLGLLFAAGCQTSIEGPNGHVRSSVPLGPDGEAVIDRFCFMHQPLILLRGGCAVLEPADFRPPA
jgi:hypothetical protein